MNHESLENCALSAPRGEAASQDKADQAHENLLKLRDDIMLALNSGNPLFQRAIRRTLRDIARLFDIPVSGQD